VTADECRTWLTAWSRDWIAATYVVGAPAEPIEAYVAQAGAEPLDDAIHALCVTYLATDCDGRAVIREFFATQRPFCYNLLNYVFRMATALRRDPRSAHVRGALVATAIEDAREDYRDSIVALLVLRWAAARMAVDPAPEFEAVAAVAGETTARLIRDVAQRHVSQAEQAAQQMTAKTWRDLFPPRGAGG
jgi:hypothetical protein